MPSPNGAVIPGARNFSGVSRNEIASTIPSQTNGTPTCTTPAKPTLIAGVDEAITPPADRARPAAEL